VPMLEQLLTALRSMSAMFVDERGLQDKVEQRLADQGVPYRREVTLGPRDRIDFMVGDNIGVECKIDHSRADLLRQLFRYCHQPSIRVLVVVLGKLRLSSLPTEINGVPIHVVNVVRAFA